jgi:acetyl-CoA carboxylase alpha subunit
MADALGRNLKELKGMDAQALQADRYARFRQLGSVLETATAET